MHMNDFIDHAVNDVEIRTKPWDTLNDTQWNEIWDVTAIPTNTVTGEAIWRATWGIEQNINERFH